MADQVPAIPYAAVAKADTQPKRQALQRPAGVSNLNEQIAILEMRDRIVAVGLLTQRDLKLLGPTFDRIWPVEDVPQFEELIQAIDRADEHFEHKPKMIQER